MEVTQNEQRQNDLYSAAVILYSHNATPRLNSLESQQIK